MAGLLIALPFLFIATGYAQEGQPRTSYPRVDYYRSPFPNALSIDPLGELLGRIGMKYERRTDPLFSSFFEFSYQRDVKKKDFDTTLPAYSIGVGERIYLRDNAAMEGVYVGVQGAVSFISSSLTLRLTPEIGYKVRLGNSHFFIEPLILYDAFLFHIHGAKSVLPYVALPIGYMW